MAFFGMKLRTEDILFPHRGGKRQSSASSAIQPPPRDSTAAASGVAGQARTWSAFEADRVGCLICALAHGWIFGSSDRLHRLGIRRVVRQ